MLNFIMSMATLCNVQLRFCIVLVQFILFFLQDPIIDGEAVRRRSVLRQLCRSGPVCRRQSGAIGPEKELNQKAGQADMLAARGRFWRKTGGKGTNLAANRRQADESGGKLTILAAC
jgi:hypothetical protein